MNVRLLCLLICIVLLVTLWGCGSSPSSFPSPLPQSHNLSKKPMSMANPTNTPIALPSPQMPTPMPTNEESVESEFPIRSGFFRLYSSEANPSKSRYDLDAGQVTGPENDAADIEFYTSIGSMVFDFLKTVNDARAQVFLANVTDLGDCIAQLDELAPTMIPDYNLGPICVVTNQGGLALLEYRLSDLREGQEWVEYNFSYQQTLP